MSASRKKAAKRPAASPKKPRPSGTPRDLVILTGLSGSGKASALKAFEDLGFYAVDNMPVMLMRPFAELVAHSRDIRRAALVVAAIQSPTARKTRGLTRSATALMTSPLPAPPRFSKTTQTFRLFATTHSCSLTGSACSFASSRSQAFPGRFVARRERRPLAIQFSRPFRC